MKRQKLVSIFILAGILNLNFLPMGALAFGSKKVLNAQVSEYKFEYVNMNWWESFDDDILKGYIVKAIEQNQDLKIATLKVEEFNQLTKLQFAKELPSLSIAPGIGNIKMAGGDATGSFSFPMVVNYEADVFLKNRTKTKSAKKQYEASKFEERATCIAISSAVASTYLNLVKIDKLIAVQKDIIEYKKQIYDLMMKRNKQGITSTADTVKANKELVFAETDLIEMEKSRNLLLNKLAVLIGESPVDAQELQRISYDDLKFKQDIPSEIPSSIILKRPDILKAENQVEKAGLDIKIARKEFLPSFNILGLAFFSSSALSSSFNWANAMSFFGGNAVFSVFSGGQKVANLRLKKNQYEQVLQNYHKTNLTAIQEVNDALSSLKLDDEKYNQNLKKLQMEEADFGYNQQKYKQGVISYLDLIQHKENLLMMNKTVAANKTDCMIDYISLYKATGSKIGGSNL